MGGAFKRLVSGSSVFIEPFMGFLPDTFWLRLSFEGLPSRDRASRVVEGRRFFGGGAANARESVV